MKQFDAAWIYAFVKGYRKFCSKKVVTGFVLSFDLTLNEYFVGYIPVEKRILDDKKLTARVAPAYRF